MKVEDFRVFVNSNILPNLVPGIETKGLSKVSLEKGITNTTARKWLHYLGCYYKEGRKDVYYDGHEREDVVKYRNEFVPRLFHGLMTLISFLCSKMRLFTSRMNARLRTGIYQRTLKQVKPQMFI